MWDFEGGEVVGVVVDRTLGMSVVLSILSSSGLPSLPDGTTRGVPVPLCALFSSVVDPMIRGHVLCSSTRAGTLRHDRSDVNSGLSSNLSADAAVASSSTKPRGGRKKSWRCSVGDALMVALKVRLTRCARSRSRIGRHERMSSSSSGISKIALQWRGKSMISAVV